MLTCDKHAGMSMVGSAELAPGETKEIVFVPVIHFRAERLVFGEVARPRWRAILEHLRYFPLFILSNLVAMVDDRDFPRWKKLSYIPLNLVQVAVDGVKQFREDMSVPAEIFGGDCPISNFQFAICRKGAPIVITLKSVAKHPINCRFMIVGRGFI